MPLEPIETLPLEGNDTQQLVFVDSNVQDSQTLIDNVSGAAEVIVLDSDTDELVQISERLSNYQDLDAVHIVSHGEAGQLTFGNATLNSDTLPDYQEVLEDWSLALDADADLLLYACDTASGELGNAFIQQVSEITGADVAASIDDTGISGDWELETEVGEIEATSVFDDAIESAYQHDLLDASVSESFGGGGSISDGGSAALDAFDDQVNSELGSSGDDDLADVNAEDNRGSGAGTLLTRTFGNAPRVLVASTDFAGDDYETFKRMANDFASENPEEAPEITAIAIPILLYKIVEGVIVVGITALSIDTINKANDLNEALEDSKVNVHTAQPPIIGPLPEEEIIRGLPRPEDELEFVTTPPLDFERVGKIKPEAFPNGDAFLEAIENGKFEFPSEEAISFNNLSINSNDGGIIDNDDLWTDADIYGDEQFSYPGVSNPEATNIANGHSFPDHKREFPGVETREDFAKVIDGVILNPTQSKTDLNNGRKGYWDDVNGILVVIDPQDADNGTAYKPENGKADFDKLE